MSHSVCPVERAGLLDNPFRHLLIRPVHLLGPYIMPGMIVLDIGCGPGFFIKTVAKLSGPDGVIIAADLQQGMLDILAEKITREGLTDRVILHKTKVDSLNFSKENYIDFAFAYHVIHEVPRPDKLFCEVYTILKPGGLFLLSEPKGHVKRVEFENQCFHAKNAGFQIVSEKNSLMEFQSILKKHD